MANPTCSSLTNNDNLISLLLGAGNGSFQAARNYVAGVQGESIGIVPLNDGAALVFATDGFTGDVHIILAPGDGTLSAPPMYQAGGNATAIEGPT